MTPTTLEARKQAEALFFENSKKLAKIRPYRFELDETVQSLLAVIVNIHQIQGLLLDERS